MTAGAGWHSQTYLHHCVELHCVSAPAGGEAHTGLPGTPGRVDSAVVAGAVAAPAA